MLVIEPTCRTAPQDSVPELLKKIARGKRVTLSRREIFDYNMPNYPFEDILLDSMVMDIAPYDPAKKHNHVHAEGTSIDLSRAAGQGGSFPELRWEHMNMTLLAVIITQAGRTSHNVCSEGRNGVALRSMTMQFRRQAPLERLQFEYESEIYERHHEVWADSRWEFYCRDKKFVDFMITSRGVLRSYDGVEANFLNAAPSSQPIGERLVGIQAITPWQRDVLLTKQQELAAQGEAVRFGRLAVESGFCSKEQAASCAA